MKESLVQLALLNPFTHVTSKTRNSGIIFFCNFTFYRVRGNLWTQNLEEETEEDFHMKNNEIRQYIDEKLV